MYVLAMFHNLETLQPCAQLLRVMSFVSSIGASNSSLHLGLSGLWELVKTHVNVHEDGESATPSRSDRCLEEILSCSRCHTRRLERKRAVSSCNMFRPYIWAFASLANTGARIVLNKSCWGVQYDDLGGDIYGTSNLHYSTDAPAFTLQYAQPSHVSS